MDRTTAFHGRRGRIGLRLLVMMIVAVCGLIVIATLWARRDGQSPDPSANGRQEPTECLDEREPLTRLWCPIHNAVGELTSGVRDNLADYARQLPRLVAAIPGNAAVPDHRVFPGLVFKPGKEIVAGLGKAVLIFPGAKGSVLSHHASKVRQACYSKDKQYVRTVCADGDVYLWELPIARHYVPSPLSLKLGDIDHEGARVVTLDRRGTPWLWKAHPSTNVWEEGREIAQLREKGPLASLSFAGDSSRYLLALGVNGCAYVYDATGWKLIYATTESEGRVLNAALSPDGRQLALATQRGVELREVAANTGASKVLQETPSDCEKPKLAFSGDGSRLVVGWDDRRPHDCRIYLFDPASLKQIGPAMHVPSAMKSLRLGRSGQRDWLAVATYDNQVTIWDISNEGFVEKWAVLAHKEDVVGMCFPTNGPWIITGSRDGVVLRWDIADRDLSEKRRRPEESLETGVTGLRAVALTTDDQWLVVVSDESAWTRSFVPAGWKGTPRQLRARAECYTGVTMTNERELKPLSVEEWQQACDETESKTGN